MRLQQQRNSFLRHVLCVLLHSGKNSIQEFPPIPCWKHELTLAQIFLPSSFLSSLALWCVSQENENGIFLFSTPPVPSPAIRASITLHYVRALMLSYRFSPNGNPYSALTLAEACFPVTADGRSQLQHMERLCWRQRWDFLVNSADKQNKRACGNFLSSQIINFSLSE